jgi:hemoglobin
MAVLLLRRAVQSTAFSVRPRELPAGVNHFLRRFEADPSAGGGEEMATLYEHAGGEEALHRLEERFYAKALADPVLKAQFTERRPHHVDHLTSFTAESFGGPDRFTRELGFRHVIDAHRHLRITEEQRERFVALYLEALDEAGLPTDEPFRAAVRSHVEFGSRVAQQNSWAETEGDLHPIRSVPRWPWPANPSREVGSPAT